MTEELDKVGPGLRGLMGNMGWLMVDRIVRMGMGLFVDWKELWCEGCCTMGSQSLPSSTCYRSMPGDPYGGVAVVVEYRSGDGQLFQRPTFVSSSIEPLFGDDPFDWRVHKIVLLQICERSADRVLVVYVVLVLQ